MCFRFEAHRRFCFLLSLCIQIPSIAGSSQSAKHINFNSTVIATLSGDTSFQSPVNKLVYLKARAHIYEYELYTLA